MKALPFPELIQSLIPKLEKVDDFDDSLKPEVAEEASPFLYAIVDCAQLGVEFYNETTRNEKITAKTLFADTPHESSAEAGPLLIHINAITPSDFVETLTHIEENAHTVLWLKSEVAFERLLPKLTMMLFIETSDGRPHLFRYYDPRQIQNALVVFVEDSKTQEILQLISGWAYWDRDHYRYLEKADTPREG